MPSTHMLSEAAQSLQVTKADLSWPLRRAVRLAPGSPAILDGSRTLTYAELANRIGALGAALESLGVDRGGRVGFLGFNSIAHIECTMGVPMFGRVLVSLNFRLAVAELVFIVNDCGIEVLVVDSEHLEVAGQLRESCPSLRAVITVDAVDVPDCLAYEALLDREPIEAVACDEDELAAICYTGGTTGRPKGVMLSHGNLLANALHNIIVTSHARSDVWLHVCAMFHVAGTANVFACTWVGARQVTIPRFVAADVVETVLEHQITHVSLVPTMVAMLLDELDRRPDVHMDSLRHIQYAASPITPNVQRRLLERFDVEVVQLYGMTEAAPTVTRLSDADHRAGLSGDARAAARLRSVGVPVVGVEAEVRGEHRSCAAVDEVGELWVRGPNVMLGYWNRPEVTREAMIDGWYRTGDAAYRDAGGYIYLVDRLKDMIITGAENVYSIEVEATLTDHPAVLEAAVFGVPDTTWGEIVHAVVAVTDGSAVTVEELIAHCRAQIAGYKVPRRIELRTDPLPKSGAGKVLKEELRKPFWAGHERRVN